jgi:two-component system, NtrC family, sensor kinase
VTTDALARKLERAERSIAILEQMIEDKTRELFLTNESLLSSNQDFSDLLDVMPGALVVIDSVGTIRRVNRSTLELLGYAKDELTGQPAERVFGPASSSGQTPRLVRREADWLGASGSGVPVLVSISEQSARGGGADGSTICIGVDLRERKQLEVELRHAQKLESVGQLAAGIAHEINTPMQFIGDNVHFVGEALSGLLKLIDSYEQLLAAGPKLSREQKAELEKMRDEANLDFVRQRGPRAIERTLMGVGRVSQIVAAMKAFSHPHDEKAPVDLNKAVETTLTVAHSEYKYVAEAELELGDIPLVVCHGGDINQVLLNLVVNAAHAIDAARTKADPLGKIRIKTAHEANVVTLSVSDTGGGIPEAIRERIFDPFFTTKQVGKGTGQGLTLAHTIVVKKHGGQLSFETQTGRGTVFSIRLPVDGKPITPEAAA